MILGLLVLGLVACGSQPTGVEEEVVVVADTKFSVDRGFFNQSFNVDVFTATPDAFIKYTLDGSDPTTSPSAVSTQAPASVFIDASGAAPAVVLRAIGFKQGMNSTNVDSQTYVFPHRVSLQSKPRGYPETWAYGVQSAEPAALTQALLSLPTLSIAGASSDLFHPTMGVLGLNKNATDVDTAARPVTVEMVDSQDPSRSFQIEAGIKAHSDTNQHGKRSLRLNFNKKYGGKLNKNVFDYSTHHAEGARKKGIDALVLRAGSSDALFSNVCNRAGEATYLADQFSRDNQLAASGYGVRGFYVHLYLNGLYWGVYNVVERPTAQLWAGLLGGAEEAWTVADHDEAAGPRLDAWQLLTRTRLPSAKQVQQLLDLHPFADYMLIHLLSGTGDWPGSNWHAGLSSAAPFRRARFLVWDAEESWTTQQCSADGQLRSHAGAWVSPALLKDDDVISRLWRLLHNTPQLRTAFADAVYRNCFNDGPLSDAKLQKRWSELSNQLSPAIAGEAARWGSFKGGGGSNWSPGDWSQAVGRVSAAIAGNSKQLVAALRNTNVPARHPRYFPLLLPPTIERVAAAGKGAGAEVTTMQLTLPRGSQLKLSSSVGVLWYTINGKDPKNGGRAVGVNGGRSRVVTFNKQLTLKTRVRLGKAWSPLRELRVFMAQDFSQLRLTELMYHPIDDAQEYLELHNAGNRAMRLNGLQLPELEAEFLDEARVLGPQEHALVVRNISAFLAWYGSSYFSSIIAEYPGKKLSNKGEIVTVRAADGEILLQVDYKDSWHASTDGEGRSLVLNDCSTADLGAQDNWRASFLEMGSPAEADAASACDYEKAQATNSLNWQGVAVAKPSAPTVTWDSCLGRCACTVLNDDFCCSADLWDATCSAKAVSSPACATKCN